MIEHYIDNNNIYHIVINKKEVLSISLDAEYNHIHIETETDIYNGPAHLLLK